MWSLINENLIISSVITAGIIALISFGIKTFREKISIEPDSLKKKLGRIERLLNAGRKEKAKRLYSQILKILDAAIENDQRNAELFFQKARVYDLIGNIKEAFGNYNKAIKIDQKYYRAYERRGSLYHDTGDYDNAIRDYTEALNINRKDRILINRAYAYRDRGIYDKALEDFNSVLDTDTDSENADAYNGRGKLFLKKGEGWYDKAIEDFDEAIKLKYDYSKAYLNRGLAYACKKAYGIASKNFKLAYDFDKSGYCAEIIVNLFRKGIIIKN